MRGRIARRFLVAAAISSLVASAQLGPAEVAQAADDEWRGTVLSRFVFDADRSGQLEITESTRLLVPTSHPKVKRFLGAGAGRQSPARSKLRQRARDWIDADLGLFYYPFLERPASLGAVEIERGRLVVEAEDRQGTEQEEEGAREEGRWFGPFFLASEGMMLKSSEPRPSADVGWVVRLELDQTGVGSLRPPPTTLDRDGSHTTVVWRFPPGAAAPLRVDLEPPWTVDLAADEGAETDLLGQLGYLLVVLLFLPVLSFLLRRRDLRTALPDVDLLRQQLRRLLIAAALLVAIAVALWIMNWTLDRFDRLQSWPELPRQLIIDLPILLAAAAVAAVFSAGRRPTAWRWIVPLYVLVAAVIVLTRIRILVVDFEHDPTDWEVILAALDVVVIGLLLFAFLDGLIRVCLYWLEVGRDPASAFGAWRPRADVPALLVALILLAVSMNSLTGRLSGNAFGHKLLYEAPSMIFGLALYGAPLLSLALLPGAARLLSETRRPEPFLVAQRGRWLVAAALFLLFVVPTSGSMAGIQAPMPLLVGVAAFALLVLLRLARLERLEREVALRNLGPDLLRRTGLLTRNAREIVDRALLIERVQRERRGVRQQGEGDGVWAEEHGAARAQLSRLDAAERYLQTGDPPPGTTPSRADRETVSLRFPSRPPLLYPALGCGPGRNWRESGRIALRYGAWLALPAIVFFLFILFRHDLDQILHSELGTEPLLLLALIGQEVAFWLVAAFIFGCLFSWLPGANGLLKGLVLSLPVAAAVGAMALCPIFQVESDQALRPFVLLLFLSLLGLLMDFRTVRGAGLRNPQPGRALPGALRALRPDQSGAAGDRRGRHLPGHPGRQPAGGARRCGHLRAHAHLRSDRRRIAIVVCP